MNPSFGGLDLFGAACRVVHTPRPAAVQKSAFQGPSGVAALFGGPRGRTFEVSGVFVGPDVPTVLACEAALLAYADAVARTFVDTQGRAWPNVIFEGDYRPGPEGPRPTDTGWCLPYHCTLHGKT